MGRDVCPTKRHEIIGRFINFDEMFLQLFLFITTLKHLAHRVITTISIYGGHLHLVQNKDVTIGVSQSLSYHKVSSVFE